MDDIRAFLSGEHKAVAGKYQHKLCTQEELESFDPNDTSQVWSLVIANESQLRNAVLRGLPRELAKYAEDVYSDVVLSRACSIMRTYKAAAGASPGAHLVINAKWYIYKWVVAALKNKRVTDQLDNELVGGHNNGSYDAEYVALIDLEIDATSLLDALHIQRGERARQVVYRRFILNESLTSIAKDLGTTVVELKQYIEELVMWLRQKLS